MEETHFRAIWLSDIHLGTRSCKAGALLDFLDACDCEYLYLVGDIIDFWKLKRAPYRPQIQRRHPEGVVQGSRRHRRHVRARQS